MTSIHKNYIKCFGIEASAEILWTKWQPGNEYIKNLIIKNVNSKPQRIEYRKPSLKFFLVSKPKNILLSSGKCFSLPIIFKPAERIVYFDKLEIITQNGIIEIPLKATVPCYSLNLPPYVNCGVTIVGNDLQANLTIENNSELETPFKIDCLDPFDIFPAYGTLEPYGHTTLKIKFTPLQAKIYKALFVINYGLSLSCSRVFDVTGQGKYPCFTIESCDTDCCNEDQPVINFGEQIVGMQIKKLIKITNKLNLATKIIINRLNFNNPEEPFKIKEKEIILPSLQNVFLPVYYTAKEPDYVSVEYFSFSARSSAQLDIKTQIKCFGKSIGPKIFFNMSEIYFGEAKANQISQQTITIMNDSLCPGYFQFELDNSESIFNIHPICGFLGANDRMTITLTFKPIYAFNYFRRISCILHQQGVKFLNIMGTCISDELNLPLMREINLYINRYTKHVQRGLSTISQEKLLKMLDIGELSVDFDNSLTYTNNRDLILFSCPFSDNLDEYFHDGFYSSYSTHLPHLSFDTKEINFDYLSANQFSFKILNATNHTEDAIFIRWMTDTKRSFYIEPSCFEIESQKTVSFKVIFCPSISNNFFGAELEGYYCYKYALQEISTDIRILLPSWCVTVKVIGHSFDPGCEPYVPKYNLDSNKHLMSTVMPGMSAYKTILLSNQGQTPILFSLKNECEIFSQKPYHGLVSIGNVQIFIVKFQPDDSLCEFESNFTLSLNYNEAYDQLINLKGTIENAAIELSSEGNVFLPPASVGSFSIGHSYVTNLSRLPIMFDASLKSDEKEVLEVLPCQTIIQPFEKLKLDWTFMPTIMSKYIFKPTFKTWAAMENLITRPINKYFVRIIASSFIPFITCQEELVDLGTILAGTSSCRYLTIGNNENCKAHFILQAQEILKSEYLENSLLREPIALKFGEDKMSLNGRTKGKIAIFINANERANLQWNIKVQMLNFKGEILECLPPTFLCTVKVKVIFPSINIFDISGFGSAMCLNKQNLWKLFNIKKLNDLLYDDPMPEELKFKVPTRNSLTRKFETETKALVVMDFNASPIGSEPSIIQLALKNTTELLVKWSILFSFDLQIKLDFKIGKEEVDEIGQYEDMLLDNQIFNICERSGTIEPNCIAMLKFTYEHKIVGVNELTLLLKIDYGREILMKLRGRTLATDEDYLQLIDTNFALNSLPIGLVRAPIQSFKLYNAGNNPLRFSIDEESLNRINMENFNHKVFECLNLNGCIDPYTTHSIEFKFLPLEVKTYKTNLKLTINESETKYIEISGSGYDKILFGNLKPINNSDLDEMFDNAKSEYCGQLCNLSIEEISFENLPLYSVRKRLIFINNTSLQPISFVWRLTQNFHHNIEINPEKEVIKAHESKLCMLTFTTHNMPAFFDANIICEITNLNEFTKYENDVQLAKFKQSKIENEFTINDSNVNFQDSNCENSLIYLPNAPKPQVLHLNVSACLHDVDEYLKEYDDKKTAYIDKSLIKMDDIKYSAIKQDNLNLIVSTMSCLINDLLNDEEFYKACLELQSEPVPYFVQFKTECGSTEDDMNQNFNSKSSTKDHYDKCEDILRSPEFGNFLESVLDNTIYNILQESYFGEFNITARPRLVALPLKPSVIKNY